MKCDLCGQPAVSIVRDIRETEPVTDAKGRMWATAEYAGPARTRCQEHHQPHKKFCRDGTVRVMPDDLDAVRGLVCLGYTPYSEVGFRTPGT
jgi:hypothetical protein